MQFVDEHLQTGAERFLSATDEVPLVDKSFGAAAEPFFSPTEPFWPVRIICTLKPQPFEEMPKQYDKNTA